MKSEAEVLNETIDWLNEKQTTNLKLLNEQFYQTYRSLRLVYIINDALEGADILPKIKQNTLKGFLGLAIGYLTNRMVFGASQKLLQRNTPVLLQMMVATVALKNSTKIVAGAENMLKYLFQYRIKSK